MGSPLGGDDGETTCNHESIEKDRRARAGAGARGRVSTWRLRTPHTSTSTPSSCHGQEQLQLRAQRRPAGKPEREERAPNLRGGRRGGRAPEGRPAMPPVLGRRQHEHQLHAHREHPIERLLQGALRDADLRGDRRSDILRLQVRRALRLPHARRRATRAHAYSLRTRLLRRAPCARAHPSPYRSATPPPAPATAAPHPRTGT